MATTNVVGMAYLHVFSFLTNAVAYTSPLRERHPVSPVCRLFHFSRCHSYVTAHMLTCYSRVFRLCWENTFLFLTFSGHPFCILPPSPHYFILYLILVSYHTPGQQSVINTVSAHSFRQCVPHTHLTCGDYICDVIDYEYFMFSRLRLRLRLQ